VAISSTRPKENAPHEAGHYWSLVARGGIEPPTQGFLIICLSQLSLLLSISRAWVASFNLLKILPYLRQSTTTVPMNVL